MAKLFISFFISLSSCAYISNHTPKESVFKKKFAEVYKKLEIEAFELSQEKNIIKIVNFAEKKGLDESLLKIEILSEGCGQTLFCSVLKHEHSRLQQRKSLSKLLSTYNISDLEGLKRSPSLYKKFYKHSLYEWTNDFSLSVEKLVNFQKKEIVQIKKKIATLPNVETKKLFSAKEVEKVLAKKIKILSKNIKKTFTQKKIARLKILKNKNPNTQQVPGYYDASSQTFYFSIPKDGLNPADLDWLLLHEGSPGHHMQMSLNENSIPKSIFNRSMLYLDFIEGWAAYVETYGEKLGLYQTQAAKRKALEWDLVRSTRVIIDIGLHLKGWSTDYAKKTWFKTAPEVYYLADREIARMQRWPAQVVAYEYGKMNFLKARDAYIAKTNKSVLDFHEFILSQGQVPTHLI